MNRTALITGASAGLGAEFARQLAAQGYDVVLVARRAERLEALADELRTTYAITAIPLAADLAEPGAPARLHTEIGSRGVVVSYLVNNAGASGPDLLEERDWPTLAAYLELMMISVAHMVHLFAPAMVQQRFGRIINVASVAGRISRADDLNYGPSKAYLIALSENLDLSLKREGVRVSALCPGFTHTEFHDVAGMQEQKAALPDFIWYDADVVACEPSNGGET